MMAVKTLLLAGIATVLLAAWTSSSARAADQPCQASLEYLMHQYSTDPDTKDAFQAAYEGLKPLPPGYAYGGSRENPWTQAGDGAGLYRMVLDFYREVCVLLPQIVGSHDNALDSIQYFAWIYYRNEAGVRLVKEKISSFLTKFNQDYKAYMDSAASTKHVSEWIQDPRLEIGDYVKTQADEYASWNDFFARNLVHDPQTGTYPARPVTMPSRDYVVVSPTDCIMNPLVQVLKPEGRPATRRLIDNPLELGTVLDVKGIPISLDRMLANTPAELKAKFVGGTGLTCVLMPNTYHHFHSPVDGVIRYAELVEAGSKYACGTFGYDDWANWVPLDGNVGRPGTDFSQFQGFQRGVIIIEVRYANLPGRSPSILTGYVASIPVGLDTVGSVVLADQVAKGARVQKGVTPFGNFFLGGSLNILLFSPIQGTDGRPMVNPAVQTRMGNQIAILNTPYPPPKTPWTPD